MNKIEIQKLSSGKFAVYEKGNIIAIVHDEEELDMFLMSKIGPFEQVKDVRLIVA